MTSLSVVNAGGAEDPDPPAGGGGAPFVVVVVEDIYFTRFALCRRMKEESNAHRNSNLCVDHFCVWNDTTKTPVIIAVSIVRSNRLVVFVIDDRSRTYFSMYLCYQTIDLAQWKRVGK